MIVLALQDYREYLISTGALRHDEAHAPWALPAVKDFLTWRLSEPHNPWIGVGPDHSRALTFSTADNKGLQAGVVESNGAVRSFHWEHCAMGQLLRAAGVPCDMTLSEGGRNTVTHNCKQYALNLAAMVGVDYASIQFVASHERDITRMHYLTLATDALHKMAGTCL
ncbi:hypothetical protein WJX72_012253 [[Myrmecia] bisecta]|uniref:Uncharacterized protein n=1 Tax=[Myrmecia] bisecta TaxID=41462 RepID=A0AAW1RAD5_9CHLO